MTAGGGQTEARAGAAGEASPDAGSGRVGAALLAAALVVALGVAFERGRDRAAERAAFPPAEGRLVLVGPRAPVEILRDARGVPHVRAAEVGDALFGLGYVHAQDRLGQMQWLLRLAQGRSAEVAGREGLPADRLARTLDLAGLAEREAESLDPATRSRLEAYARGVNARIRRVREGRAAPPVGVARAGMPLADWRPADTLAVLKLYAWSLGESMAAGLVLDDLLGRLGGVEARRFFPGPVPGESPPPLEALPFTAGVVPAEAWRDPLRRALGLEGRSVGSSAWVLGGAHSESGAPLLVADAHLEPTAPPLLHVAHVRGGDLDVAGAALPGVPGVWTGHSRRVAWAATHARAAVMDLYTETLHPGGEPRYHDGRRWRPIRERVERIAVEGGGAETLVVRRTHHGPLVGELLRERGEPVAVAWVGQRGRGGDTLRALHEMALAGDAAAFLAALDGLAEPALAVVYADAAGAAGMHVAGWIPLRPLDTELVPVPGRARWYDWKGRIPFDELPAVKLRRGRGWAVAADNRLGAAAEGEAEWLWRSGVVARRIEEGLAELSGRGSVGLRELAALQRDVVDGRARALVRGVSALVGEGDELGREAREVAGLLSGWDGRSEPGSAGAAAYHVFVVILTDALLRPVLGDELLERYLALPQADPARVVAGIVSDAAAGEVGEGWAARERVVEAVRSSLREAWFTLSYRLGANRSKWRWGRLHGLAFRPFGPAAGDDHPLGPFEAGGSGTTVNVAAYRPDAPFAVRVASTFRFAVDAGALDHSLFVLAPGQSEHPGHRHHADAVARWLAGDSTLLVTSALLVDDAVVGRLVLEPAP